MLINFDLPYFIRKNRNTKGNDAKSRSIGKNTQAKFETHTQTVEQVYAFIRRKDFASRLLFLR